MIDSSWSISGRSKPDRAENTGKSRSKCRTRGVLSLPWHCLEFEVTPVPEAETYAMLLAGLGLVGFAAKRRKAL